MRIGIYDPYLDDCGGGEKYMLTIAECLGDKNQVDIFWENEKDLELVRNRFGLSLDNVKIVPNIFNKNLIQKLKETKKYDVIIFLSDGSIPLVSSKKLFLHIQRPILGFGRRFIDKAKLKKVSAIFVNSHFTKKYIENVSGLNCKVIYPPVNIKSKKIKKENVILHVGRFRVKDSTVLGASDFKKQNVMVDAFIQMYRKERLNWKFVLAVSVKDEDHAEFDKLMEKAKGYPIEFVENKTNEELWELYSRAKIYWHASGYGEDLGKNPELAEHFGISTVEAMGASCVPVVINAGGQKEIVEDGVSGLLWSSLEELQDKTHALTKDSGLLEKLSRGALTRSKTFSGERFCQEINELIGD